MPVPAMEHVNYGEPVETIEKHTTASPTPKVIIPVY
jgi:hypothetical protein